MKYFVFKGRLYKRSYNRFTGATEITCITPDYDVDPPVSQKHSATRKEEPIPDHLRNLNKRQLRALVIKLEALVND